MSEYRKGIPPEVSAEMQNFAEYTNKELAGIQQALAEKDLITLVELARVPDKLQTGMIVLADGTNWDPGSGAGFYGYYGGAWHKLG